MFRRNQSGDVTKIYANLLCYLAVSFWTNTERLRSHRFHSAHSTAESSATNGYVIVPERFGQNEEPDGRIGERAWKRPSFVSSSGYD